MVRGPGSDVEEEMRLHHLGLRVDVGLKRHKGQDTYFNIINSNAKPESVKNSTLILNNLIGYQGT